MQKAFMEEYLKFLANSHLRQSTYADSHKKTTLTKFFNLFR